MKYKIRVVVGIIALIAIAIFGVILPVLQKEKEAGTAGTEITYGFSEETPPSASGSSLSEDPEPTSSLAWDWPDSTGGEIAVDPASGSDIPEK